MSTFWMMVKLNEQICKSGMDDEKHQTPLWLQITLTLGCIILGYRIEVAGGVMK